MLEEIAGYPHFANGGRDAVGTAPRGLEVLPIWEKYFKRLPSSEALGILNAHGAHAVEMLGLNEVFDHPQVKSLSLSANLGNVSSTCVHRGKFHGAISRWHHRPLVVSIRSGYYLPFCPRINEDEARGPQDGNGAK